MQAACISGCRGRRRCAGFTLVEVLVALLAMALLASLAWQGLDGVLRSREHSRDLVDRTLRLTTVLTQWEQDLLAVHDTGVVPALAFDGQTLRLTRRVDEGVAVVAWSVRASVWQRWVGPPLVRAAELQEVWLRSQQFLGTEPGHLTLVDAPASWQVYFHRGSNWSNAQSSGDLVVAPPPAPGASAPDGAEPPKFAREQLPNAVRIVITLDGAALTRDIALGPQGS